MRPQAAVSAAVLLLLAVAPEATPPDFSHDANVSIVAKNGNVLETSIAISPVNPNVIVFAGIDVSGDARISTWRSDDGGVTWSDPQPQSLTASGTAFGRSVDPVVIADKDGTFYLAELLEAGPKGTFGGSVIAVTRSSDGGRTWSDAVVVVQRDLNATPTPADDKEWIAVDPDTGTLTVAWSYFLTNGPTVVGTATILVAQSTDRGDHWSTPRPIRNDDVQLTQVVAAGGGATYLSYDDFTKNNAYIVRASSDGGATFGDEVKAIVDPDIQGWLLDNTKTLVATTHTLAVDTSTGPHHGNVYLVAGARKNVLFARSRDGGKHWSGPLRLSSPSELFYPTVAVDESNGDIVISWYDRRDDPHDVLARIYAIRSTDGGETFSQPRAFTSSFAVAGKMGDYDTTAVSHGHAIRAFSNAGGFAAVARLDFSAPPQFPHHRPAAPTASPGR